MATVGQSITILRRTVVTRQETEASEPAWWQELVWVAAAGLVGFATTAVLAWWLAMPRSWLVLVYAAVTVPLFVVYARWSGIDPRAIAVRHWRLGVAGAVVAGALLAAAVQNQDGSARPGGVHLAWDIFWLGLVYGVIDALLLNVLPVLATWRALSRRGWTERWAGKVGVGALALLASLLVTAAYHLGYPEFQWTDVKDPLIGNAVASLSYVVTANPIAAIGSHVAMHVAAVLHGAEGTVQLPPHY
jgi:hypothetical protein